MHAYHFKIPCDKIVDAEVNLAGPPARKWVEAAAMDEETLSTGMRKCWDLVAKSG